MTFAFFVVCSAAQQYSLSLTFEPILRPPINPNNTTSDTQAHRIIYSTTFETQNQYTGHVGMLPFTSDPDKQNSSTVPVFRFSGSCTSPGISPPVAWLDDGLCSSIHDLVQERGPYEIMQLSDDSYSTLSRLRDCEESLNLLAINQTIQTGFAFDESFRKSVNPNKDDYFEPKSRNLPQVVLTDTSLWHLMNDTSAAGHSNHTQDSAIMFGRENCEFFPGYSPALCLYNTGTPPNDTITESAGANMFAESYGGFHDANFVNFLKNQSYRFKNYSVSARVGDVQLSAVSIVNRMRNHLVQATAAANLTRKNDQGIDKANLVDFAVGINTAVGLRSLFVQSSGKIVTRDLTTVVNQEATAESSKATKDNYYYFTCGAYARAEESVDDIRIKSEVGLNSAQDSIAFTNSTLLLTSHHPKVVISLSLGKASDSVFSTLLSSLRSTLARDVHEGFSIGDM